MRKSSLYLCLTALGATLLILLIGPHSLKKKSNADARVKRIQSLVHQLQLTDIALFTEAPYTRHPNLADRFVPFQNHPMAISQFPSESLLDLPAHVLNDRNGAEHEAAP